MIIETLIHGSKELKVGISELDNRAGLTDSQMIDVARHASEGLLALRLFDPANIAAPIHVLSAAQNALNAWLGDYAITRSLDLEIVVYASAQRQIDRALALLGLRPGLSTVGVVMIGSSETDLKAALARLSSDIGPERPTPFAPTEERLKRVAEAFGVSESEIDILAGGRTVEERVEALARCVVGRVSVVAVES